MIGCLDCEKLSSECTCEEGPVESHPELIKRLRDQVDDLRLRMVEGERKYLNELERLAYRNVEIAGEAEMLKKELMLLKARR